jgi:hypothetical protein
MTPMQRGNDSGQEPGANTTGRRPLYERQIIDDNLMRVCYILHCPPVGKAVRSLVQDRERGGRAPGDSGCDRNKLSNR